MPDPNKYPLFRLFVPTQGKIMYVAKKLMNEYLYTDDLNRNLPAIEAALSHYINNPRLNVLYEIGDFEGLLGFVNIVPGFRASLLFKLWEPERWGPDLVRQSKDFIKEVMDELHLIRLGTHTADPRIVRMGKMVGFEVEGMKRLNFLFDGYPYDEFFMSIVRKEEIKDNDSGEKKVEKKTKKKARKKEK